MNENNETQLTGSQMVNTTQMQNDIEILKKDVAILNKEIDILKNTIHTMKNSIPRPESKFDKDRRLTKESEKIKKSLTDDMKRNLRGCI